MFKESKMMYKRNELMKIIAVSMVLLFLVSGFSVMVYGSGPEKSISSGGEGGNVFSTIVSNISYSNMSNFGIKNIFYYPEYNSIVRKVIPTVNGFYVFGDFIILFKSPELQIPIRTTPTLYTDAFESGYSILSNNSIYILRNGFYYNGGGGLSLWKIFVNNGSLIDDSNILPPSWTINGNNEYWLTGAYGNGTLALAEDNYNLTECNIILLNNNVITKILTNPLGFTGTGQWASMAYADGKFLFLANDNGKTLAALIDLNGNITNVSEYFNGISLVNPNSGLMGIGNIFVIASSSTYVFDPSKLRMEKIQNSVQTALVGNFNSTTVMLAGVNSGNFTLELFDINTYNLTKIFSTSSISSLSNYGNLGPIGLGYYNGTILIAGPFLDQYGPLSTTNLENVMKGNVTFNIEPKNAWFTIDQCLCGRDMAEIALPLNNGTFQMDNAIYGEYNVYVQSPYYQDYYNTININSSNQVVNITLKKGSIEVNNFYPWIPVGPHNITLQFLNYQIAQYSAHIGLFAIDGEDPDVIYAASSVGPGMTGPIGDGGIFKTVNGGKTWIPIDLGLPYGTITGLYINESNPNELIAGVAKAGIYKTDDGGGYWFKVSNYQDAIDISYSNGKLFAGCDQGIIESDDSGDTWKLIEATNVEVNSISISGTTIYALLSNLTLMKSINLGMNWTFIYKFSGYYPYTVRASPFNSSIVYVTIGGGSVYENSINIPISVPTFYSNNGGKTFSPDPELPVKTVVFDPLNRSVMWAVGYPDLYSFDGGQSFYSSFLSVDNMGIYVDPLNDSILLAGSDQGIYESNDKGISWYPINGNIIDELSDAITTNQNGTKMLLSMQDLGTYMSYDQGESWFSVQAGPENSLVYINPYNDSWVYSLDRGASAPLRVSDNGGLSFFEISNVYSPSYIVGNKLFAVNSSDGKDVIIGTQSGLYYTTNYGLNWSLMSNSPKNITAIQYVSNDYIIIGTTDGLYVFNGKSWIEAKDISGFINSVSVDPGNTSIIAASASNGGLSGNLYLSYNKGENFTEVNSSISPLFIGANLYFILPVQFFFLNTTGYPLVAITNFGIYLSTDFGKNWYNISYNLYSGQADDLEFANDTLYIATYGAGLEEIRNFSLQSLPGTVNGNIFNNLNVYLNGEQIKTYEGHFRLFLKPGLYTFNITGMNFSETKIINVQPMEVYFINLTTNITFIESGLPPWLNWSVDLNGITKESNSNIINFEVSSNVYRYNVFLSSNYYPIPSSGLLYNLSWPNNIIHINFYPSKSYQIIFNETGLPSNTTWEVNILNNSTYYSHSKIIKINLINGTYNYYINSTGYFSVPYTGKIVVEGKNISIKIKFYYFELENITNQSLNIRGWVANSYFNGNGYLITGDPLHYYNGKTFLIPNTPGEGFFISGAWNGEYYFVVGQKWGPGDGAYAGIYYPNNNTFIDKTNLFPAELNKSVILRSVAWNGSVFFILGDYVTTSPGLTLFFEYNPLNDTIINITWKLPTAFSRDNDCCGQPQEEILSINNEIYIAIENGNNLFLGKINGNNFVNLSSYIIKGFSPYISMQDFMEYFNGSLYFEGTLNGNPEIFSLNISTFSINIIPNFINSGGQIVDGYPIPLGYAISVNYNNFKAFYIIVQMNNTYYSLNCTTLIPYSWSGINVFSYGKNDIFVNTNLKTSNLEMMGIIPLNYTFYNVTFIAKNASFLKLWYINLSNGQTIYVNGTTITFDEPNGTYSYTIATANKSYSPSPSSGTFTVNGSDVNISITFTLVTYTVTFAESGLPSGTMWYVNLSNGQSFSSTTNTITFNEPNGSYTYSISTINKEYALTQPTGSFKVNGANVNIAVPFYLVTYTITFTESGLPSGTLWFITLNGITQNSTTNTITFTEPNGSYSYTIETPISGGTGIQYVLSQSTGTLTVNGADININVPYTTQYYLTMIASPSNGGTVSPSSGWYNAGSSVTIDAISNSNFEFVSWSGTGNGSYSGTNNPVSITINGPITETANFIELYKITFMETGLPSGTMWYVNLSNGQSYNTTGNSIEIQIPNGSYSYMIATTNKEYSAQGGSLIVNGANLEISIKFNLVTYAITFTESGLSSGTSWSVTLNNIEKSSTNGTIIFNEPNGTYSYIISGISGYRTNTYSGTINVNGNPVSVSINWTIIIYPITITENGIPNGTSWSATLTGTTFNGQYINVTLSSTTNTITFNEPNGTYSYIIHLPSGYQSNSVKGQVNVSGNSAIATIKAQQIIKPQQTTNYLSIGIIAVVIVIAIVIGAILLRRGKNKQGVKEWKEPPKQN